MSDYGQPVQKKSSPWMWLGIGCGVLALGLAAFVAFIVIVVFGSMRRAAPYQEPLALAQSDSRVIEALGSPIRPGYFFSGSINTKNRDGDANLSIPIRGPKGGGILEVRATKTAGKWTYQVMKVEAKGETYDLLK